MEKSKLSQFISKYNLSGMIESVKWTLGPNGLNTKFVAPDKTLIGEVSLTGVEVASGDVEIGVYRTGLLNKMLSVLDSDVTLDIVSDSKGRNIAIGLTDGKVNANYQLADMAIIPPVPNSKSLPADSEYNLTITLDSEFTTRFVKANNALDDVEHFEIETGADGNTTVSIGFKKNNSNRITLHPECEGSIANPMPFSAKLLSQIIQANKEFKHATMLVHGDGIAKIQFTMDDFDAVYYMFPSDLGSNEETYDGEE